MARPAKLNGYSIKEVARIEVDLKSNHKIVRKLNVLETEYLKFRGKYSKQLNDEQKKYINEKELGLIIDDEPVIKTKTKVVKDGELEKEFETLKTAYENTVNELLEERDYKQNLQTKINGLEEDLQAANLEIKSLNRDKKSLSKENNDLVKEYERRIKTTEKSLRLKFDREIKDLNKQLELHQETIKISAETNAKLKETLNAAKEAIVELEEREVNLVSGYENQIKELNSKLENNTQLSSDDPFKIIKVHGSPLEVQGAFKNNVIHTLLENNEYSKEDLLYIKNNIEHCIAYINKLDVAENV
ncbi:hypothetical protein [Macrococcus sp. DPC7161]|uniref:hypothetical protein n=1 Tax=Macrococcus sp. DPC7161 TaxID=2507060 RepID=UPI00100BD384|nr:hypothetical protein [Macrococcus sp. DPC7161]RXK19072.1 hypothetical protein ER639_01795 [Macrococcus sp. DPC7161]